MRLTLQSLLLAGLVILPTALPAQRLRADRIRRAWTGSDAVELGIIGGPNRNTVTGAGAVDAKFRGSLGGFLSVPIVGSLRLRPEVSVSGKQVGFDTEIQPPCLPPGGCPAITAQETASFTWLEVPLLLEARFNGAMRDLGTPRLYAGPFVAVRLSCSFATPLVPGDPPITEDEPRVVRPCNAADGSASRYNNGDAGFVVGGTLGIGPVGLGVRWIRSLVPIAPDEFVADGIELAGAKHSTVAVTLEFATRLR